jgi:hypothetical protein
MEPGPNQNLPLAIVLPIPGVLWLWPLRLQGLCSVAVPMIIASCPGVHSGLNGMA